MCYSSVVQNNDEVAVTEFLILISGYKKDMKYIITHFISNDTFFFGLCIKPSVVAQPRLCYVQSVKVYI
jgi:hypothetical protein